MTDSTDQLLNRLRMRQVALMLAVDEHRTLRAAAGVLGMTQPAATKMLQDLEEAMGQPLFERVGRGLRLNAAGGCVLSYFRGLRGSMEALHRELQMLRQGSGGKLHIGSIMAASPAHLSEALVRLKAAYPLLAVEIVVGTSDRLVEQLNEGALDLVIGRLSGLSTREFAFRPIAEEALAVVAARGHPLVGRPSVAFAELLEHPWILQPAGSPMREVMEQEFRSHHAPLPAGLIETASILTTTNLIARTAMLAVIPQSVAGRYEQHGLLGTVAYRLRHALTAYGSIVRRDRPPSMAADRFLALLHEEAAPPVPARAARARRR